MLLDEYDYETDIEVQREEAREEGRSERKKKCSHSEKLEKGKQFLKSQMILKIQKKILLT